LVTHTDIADGLAEWCDCGGNPLFDNCVAPATFAAKPSAETFRKSLRDVPMEEASVEKLNVRATG
jgi:hypothetical protein